MRTDGGNLIYDVPCGIIAQPAALADALKRVTGVVELLGFSSGAHGALKREIDEVRERGADQFVLDLRGNGGGLLSEEGAIGSAIVGEGLDSKISSEGVSDAGISGVANADRGGEGKGGTGCRQG